jgi:hypothetical protein
MHEVAVVLDVDGGPQGIAAVGVAGVAGDNMEHAQIVQSREASTYPRPSRGLEHHQHRRLVEVLSMVSVGYISVEHIGQVADIGIHISSVYLEGARPVKQSEVGAIAGHHHSTEREQHLLCSE